MSPRTFYLLANAWGLGIGLLALFACLSFFLLPDNLNGESPAVQAQLEGWTKLYYAVYGVAGVSIIGGLAARKPHLDAFGLALFLGGLCVNLATVVTTLGLIQTIPIMGGWLAYTIGAAGRLLVVARLVRPRHEEPMVPLSELVRLAIRR